MTRCCGPTPFPRNTTSCAGHPRRLARAINPIIRGWLQYYGAFYRSALHRLLRRINAYLLRWIRTWAKRNKVELCFTPTNASWANPIEAQFGPCPGQESASITSLTRCRSLSRIA
jgi:hypothetical protein